MDLDTQLAHLRRDSATLLEAWQTDPSAAVPSCPGWDRAALLAHVTRVHAVHCRQLTAPGERVRFGDVPRPPGGDELGPVFESGVGALVAAITSADPAATFETWAGPQPAAFYPRRMAQETAVHRWDAVGGPIDPALAVDGVDEVLELFVRFVPAERLTRHATAHLHATDVDGEWLVTIDPTGITFEHGHAKGDVALRGSASDLLLWSWNRVPVDDRFAVFGDASVLDLWRSAVVF